MTPPAYKSTIERLKGNVALPRKMAIGMMLLYIMLGAVCSAAGFWALHLAGRLHGTGKVYDVALGSAIVVTVFGLWRILLSIWHLNRIRKMR